MSEDKLKELWKEFNQSEDEQSQLSEEQVKFMLTGKTNDIFSRISRNLTIGMGLLGLYVLLIIYGIYNLYFAEIALVQQIEFSPIYLAFDFIVDLSIIVSFIYFFYSFKKLSSNQISGSKLSETIKSALKILTSYRRFFYYIMAVTVASGMVSFIYGAKFGITEAEKELGKKLTENPNAELILMGFVVLIGMIFFCILVFLVWFLFKKLYGNYIEKLQDCYDEILDSEL